MSGKGLNVSGHVISIMVNTHCPGDLRSNQERRKNDVA